MPNWFLLNPFVWSMHHLSNCLQLGVMVCGPRLHFIANSSHHKGWIPSVWDGAVECECLMKKWNVSTELVVPNVHLFMSFSGGSFYTQSKVWNVKAFANSVFTFTSEPLGLCGVDLGVCLGEAESNTAVGWEQDFGFASPSVYGLNSSGTFGTNLLQLLILETVLGTKINFSLLSLCADSSKRGLLVRV